MVPDSTGGGAGEGLEALIARLESSDDSERKDAVQQLAASGDRRALEPLRQLTNDPSVSIRFFARKAVSALEKQTRPAQPETVPPPASDLSGWLARLRDPDPYARAQAVLDTYENQIPELLPELVRMLETDTEEDPRVRSALVSAIGRYLDPRTLPVLYRRLDDPDSRVRANTVDALARFSDPSVVPQLSRLANDPDNRVQANLARALGQFDPDFLHDQVQAMLESGTPWMRESALYVLWAVRDDWCRGELDVIASNPGEEPRIREMARRFPEGLARLSRPMQGVGPRVEEAADSPFLELPGEADAESGEGELEGLPEEVSAPAPPLEPAGAREILDLLEETSAAARLRGLERVTGSEDEAVWERVEMLSMEKNDEVREEARRLLRGRYGEDSIQDISTLAMSISRNIPLNELREMKHGKPPAPATPDETGAGASALDLSGYERPRSRASRGATRVSRTVQSATVPETLSPPWLKPAGVVAAVLTVALVAGLMTGPSGEPGERASGGGRGTDPAGGESKLARIAEAKDLGKYIGVAVPFQGKLAEVNERKDRFLVDSPHGKVAVQFVRPVVDTPKPGEGVEVDGVLLGKTREGYLLLRGRKIRAASGG